MNMYLVPMRDAPERYRLTEFWVNVYRKADGTLHYGQRQPSRFLSERISDATLIRFRSPISLLYRVHVRVKP